MTTSLGSAALGTEALAGTHTWSIITLAITAPGSTVASSSVTAAWTYSDSLGFAQAAWRVRLLSPLGTVLDDSSWLTGSDTSHVVDFALSGNSTYVLEVSVRNTDGQVATATTTFDAEAAPSVELVNKDVGKRWDVAINGVGYMLVHEDQNLAYQRQTVTLDAPRFATGQTALSDSIERYSFLSNPDLSGGAGQIEGDRASSSPTRFRDSWGVDPFTTPGVVGLLPTTTKVLTATNNGLTLAAVGATLYAVTGAKELSYLPTVGGAATAFTVAAAGTFTDITTDGAKWYACDSTGVWRGTTTDPGAAWSAEDAVDITWAGSRICAGVIGASSSTPNVLKTLKDDGTVESTVLTLPAGQTITALTPGGAYLYFAVYAANVGAIYAWQIGGVDAPRVVWNLPNGESPRGLFWYQGQLLIRASRNGLGVIYRCPTNDSGAITPLILAEPLDPVVDGVATGFSARGRFVYFGWSNMDGAGHAGVGIIDLSTGGYAKGMAALDTGGTTVSSIELWQGQVAFAVRGVGIYLEDTANKVTTGWYTSSVRDGASAHEKVWDEVAIQAQPLTGGASITVQYSVDRGASFLSLAGGTLSGNGNVRKTVPLVVKSSNLSWKVTLNGAARLTMVQAKVHILGLADTVLVLPIDARDGIRSPSGARTGRVDGTGVALVRSLEALAQTQVVVQDVDWPWTGLVESYEVLKVDVKTRSIREAKAGTTALALMAEVTLRRALR